MTSISVPPFRILKLVAFTLAMSRFLSECNRARALIELLRLG